MFVTEIKKKHLTTEDNFEIKLKMDVNQINE